MKFQARIGDICAIEADAIVVNLFEGVEKTGGATGAVDEKLGGVITELIKHKEMKGKLNEIHVIHSLGRLPARVVLVAGLGKQAELDVSRERNLVGEVVRTLRKHQVKSAATILHGAGAGGISTADSAQAIVEGCLLGSYEFRKHHTREDNNHRVSEIILLEREKAKLGDIKAGIEKGGICAEAAMLARDMVNEPANHMTPGDMARIAGEVAKKYGLEILVMDRQQMAEAKMGALLGVAQGTIQPPKFIVIRYKGNAAGKKEMCIVGKGLTFDSGGISLKPQEFMSDMKGDMSGGASVIAAIGAVARLKIKKNVTAIVPATENLPGGRALKPGDVLKASNGKTIEVVNTDAEGRLILADALSYAVKNKLSPIVDYATLTGACHIALGDTYAGVFTNNQQLADRFLASGKRAGENFWQLPLQEEYKELNKSDVADIKNSGGRYGGAITAALFLQEFVGETPWVHVDIAGPFMSDKAKGILVKGATGFGVRTLINFIVDYKQ